MNSSPKYVLKAHICSLFSSAGDLASKAEKALRETVATEELVDSQELRGAPEGNPD